MPSLTAKFTLPVSANWLISWPDAPVPKLAFTSGSFDVEINLASELRRVFKDKGDPYWTQKIQTIEVLVTRNDEEQVPEIILTPDGSRDMKERAKFFSFRHQQYKEKALEVSNRLLQFVQHSLHTPLVKPITETEPSLHNPTWYDQLGNELETGFGSAIASFIRSPSKIGVNVFTTQHMSALVEHMKSSEQPSLFEELLSDAQAAWFQKNLRRAVLELAICAEVMVKRTFFAKESPAGAAFDYLEDKGRISIRVLELLDVIAEEAFSRNYRKECPLGFRSIDYLFRCRNKIAHRGDLLFRDDKGAIVEADFPMVEAWWVAVLDLKNWLKSLS